MKILIKNGRVIDPENKLDEVCDILIDGNKIAKVNKNIKAAADKIIDASEKLVLPGLVDMHVHLREPGREDKETVASGTKAALKGGVTSVLTMPNTIPAIDSAENTKILKNIIKETAACNVFISGAITKEREGIELSEIASLKKCGALAITDDGFSVDNPELFAQALKIAKQEDILVISHCEDKELSGKGVVNRGPIATRLGLRGISNESEYARVKRDIDLAKKTGTRLHIAHISCKESVDLIAKAKREKLAITAETCPHYFSLTEEAVLNYDTNFKMNPPLRSKKDQEAILEGLKVGIIEVISSDHAPHTENEKDIEFDRAEFGIIGLETELAVAITELVDKKILSWSDLLERMSLAPARILGIDRGTLGEGSYADIIVIDPAREWTVEKEKIVSKSKNCAFLGKKLRGVVEYTVCNGKIHPWNL